MNPATAVDKQFGGIVSVIRTSTLTIPYQTPGLAVNGSCTQPTPVWNDAAAPMTSLSRLICSRATQRNYRLAVS